MFCSSWALALSSLGAKILIEPDIVNVCEYVQVTWCVTSFPGSPSLGMRLEHMGLTLQVHCEVCDTWRALQVLCYSRTQETHNSRFNKSPATLQCIFTHPWRRRLNMSLLPWGSSLHDSSCSSQSAILVKLLACWSRGCPAPPTSLFSLLVSDVQEGNCFCGCVGTNWGSLDKLLAFSSLLSDLFPWLQRPREVDVVDIPAAFAVRCELPTVLLLVEDEGCLLLVVVLTFDWKGFCLSRGL